ncbi:DUF4199 domain-containing protein [Mucilaginibacter boryungensis]|uniref:DUF4199 domain-containing protein n=1 Tax=Mucilaginibacter boryungensis TaxID=768480 RepID=A0ABR9XM03_9SPHI|nr:DUF4199 domain-containing protein [Mucilaginibacter boryungensis]MBE9668311.1 DUF4199 domain-containing protein [Mucilaginibacter boryungensis]
MKKLIITCGIISGLIAGLWGTFSELVLPKSTSMDMRLLLGYTSMIVAFSLIFVAIKNYRDNFGSGHISFGKALKIGLLITLIASTVYLIVWLVGSHFLYPNFLENYMAQLKHEMQAQGKSAAVINQKMAEIAQFNNPVYKVLGIYAEIVPVGVVISLIAALILKNKLKTT